MNTQLYPDFRDLVFAKTKANAEKTKRTVSCQRSTENKMKK